MLNYSYTGKFYYLLHYMWIILLNALEQGFSNYGTRIGSGMQTFNSECSAEDKGFHCLYLSHPMTNKILKKKIKIA